MSFPSLAAASALALLLLTFSASAATAASPSSPPKSTYTKATFVPPASPRSAHGAAAGWPSAANHPSRTYRPIGQVATPGHGARAAHPPASTSALHAKKKKKAGGGGGAATATKKGKVRVMMLQTVPNIGQSGDVVEVSGAVFQNQLQRGGKARLIGAEEIGALEAQREAEEAEAKEAALKTKGMIEEVMLHNLGGGAADDGSGEICGVALTMKRKAGPDGNLFGGVNPKMVMEALKGAYPGGSWDGRAVKLTDVKDGEGKDVKKKDIKRTGEYTCSVALGKGVDATFVLSVTAE